MLQFSKINDAWDIQQKQTLKKDLKNIENTVQPKEMTCKSFNHILTCDECLNKLKERLNITEKLSNNEHIVENFTNQQNNENFNGIINVKLLSEKFNNFINRNKDFKQLILIVLIFIVSVLLIQSFREPIPISDLNSKIYIYPEELAKFREIIRSTN